MGVRGAGERNLLPVSLTTLSMKSTLGCAYRDNY